MVADTAASQGEGDEDGGAVMSSPLFIDVRCQHCDKLLCMVSRDFYGLVQLPCHRCKTMNTVSLAVILRQMQDEPARMRPKLVSARTS